MKTTRAKLSKPSSRSTDLTSHAPDSQVIEVHNGFLFAASEGTPLNTMVTVVYNRHKAWKAHTRNENELCQMVARIRESVRHVISDFCTWNRFPFAAVSAIENTPDGGHGPHVHYLMHLPEDRWAELRNRLMNRLVDAMAMSRAEFDALRNKKESAAPNERNSIWLPVWISGPKSDPDRPFTPEEASAALRYLCKSFDPNATFDDRGRQVPLLWMRDTIWSHTGNARTRRRLGTTRHIGQSARRRAAWVDDQSLMFLSPEAVTQKRINERLVRYLARSAKTAPSKAGNCLCCDTTDGVPTSPATEIDAEQSGT